MPYLPYNLAMKGFGIFLLCLAVVGGIIYSVPSLRLQAEKMFSYNGCDSPLAYSLGSVDTRFGLTKDELLSDIQEAGEIWSRAEGKQLFTYSPTAKLTVNFVYDQRQALDNSITQLNDQLSQNSQTLTQQIAQYKADVAAFKQKLSELNATIEKYNSEGGAPPSIYNDLVKQQQELNAQAKALNDRARELNLSTENYNANVDVLNTDITKFQNALAQKPEEGLYDGQTTSITMYFANNRKELIHTLAHELGHALGMQHVGDEKAIMYPYTTTDLSITPDDMKQLSYVCRKQSLVIHGLQEFDIWLVHGMETLRQHLAK